MLSAFFRTLSVTYKPYIRNGLPLRKLYCSEKLKNSSRNKMESKVNKDLLMAFDFDHTLVDDNSDTVARSLLPSSDLEGGNVYVTAEKIYKETDSWTLYMREVFRILHKYSVGSDQLLSAITRIPGIAGMAQLLSSLSQANSEVIIISDSNSVFINEWLRHNQLYDLVRRVYTNPAHFNAEDQLEIEPYQRQDSCRLSEWNLCKGDVLESYIRERANENVCFKHVAFVGDGSNDLCPALRLSANDFVFARKNYALFRKLNERKSEVKANVYAWTSGDDIFRTLEQRMQSVLF